MVINTDVKSLLDVAKSIETAAGEVDAVMKKMESVLSSAHWNDKVREKFDRDFADLTSNLRKFKSEAPVTSCQGLFIITFN